MTWWNKLMPISNETKYALPYWMALRALEDGDVNGDNFAELWGTLKIALVLQCEKAPDGLWALSVIAHDLALSHPLNPDDILLVRKAIEEYDRVALNTPKQLLTKAIKKALTEVQQ